MKTLLISYEQSETNFYDWSELPGNVVELPVSTSLTEDDLDKALHNFVEKELTKYEFDVICIPVSITSAYVAYSGIRLAMHLRLSRPDIIGARKYVPIALMGFESELLIFRLSDYAPFLLTPGVRFINHDAESVRKFLEQIGQDSAINEENFKDSLDVYPIKPAPHLESTHSLANEWGAFELDRFTVNCLDRTLSDLTSDLYIKWIKAKFSINDAEDTDCVPIDFDGTAKRILYIDDEWQKGWKDVLQKIFEKSGCKQFTCLETLNKGLSEEQVIRLVEAEIKACDWDLVLLDLRLTEVDHEKETDFAGEKILAFIKGNVGKAGTPQTEGWNPVLPVIMFTASTKAKTIDRLYESGADGHFIKHSPSDSRTPEVVKESVQDFLNTVKNCLTKGQLLHPYWKRIQAIKKANIIQEHFIKETGRWTAFKHRIPERLEMFIGTLKKTFDQTEFDAHVFYYDAYETAYLTLWSCLNDIVAANYERISPQIEVAEKTQHELHPKRPKLTYPPRKFKWIERIGQEVYVELQNFRFEDGTPKSDGNGFYKILADEVSILQLSERKDSYFILRKPEVVKSWVNFQITLFNQVAFLIYAVCKRYSIEDRKRQFYWSLILEANEVRNNLWLTHSELLEKNSLSKFAQSLKDRRRRSEVSNKVEWETKISKLFELIEFLVAVK